jgi:hypothetical protein
MVKDEAFISARWRLRANSICSVSHNNAFLVETRLLFHNSLKFDKKTSLYSKVGTVSKRTISALKIDDTRRSIHFAGTK